MSFVSSVDIIFIVLTGIVLAAGKGKRFKSNLPKVLHPIYDKPILEYVLEKFQALKVKKVIIVLGSGYKKACEYLNIYKKNNKNVFLKLVKQKKQIGSGDAVKIALKSCNLKGNIIVLNGDMPLINLNSLKKIIQIHKNKNSDLTFLTTLTSNPYGYGRILRDSEYKPLKIIEEKDCNKKEKLINEINAGVYCIKYEKAKAWLNQIKNKNKQKEYYLTDLIEIGNKNGGKIKTYTTNVEEETQGVNSREDFEKVFYFMNQKILKKFHDKGITILDPRNTYIGPEVQIGRDNVIYPNTFLKGKIKISSNNSLGPNLFIEGKVTIGKNNNITYSHITDAKIGNENLIGPYARLRDSVVLGNNIKVGNFVEIKNSKIGDHTQIAHLSYIGDAVLGKKVNIGAGTITANYNSITGKKSKTIIKDRASTGSNSVLVAPVVIGESALIAAGSVITKNVPKKALAITRPKQENKLNLVKKSSDS